ncbi:threonine/homoserine/homoserine lactone efflux protein [Nocardia sp. GAS34]|uniref:LysE family translocator n=1 Tax=unclassified Nocardia TaxID=2637762 RepID=UPI003D22E912
MLHALLSFAAVAGLLTVVPGLDTALVLRAAVGRDRRYAFATAVGVGSGTLIWGVAAAAGITVLLSASEMAYTALRIVGAMYLVWMGLGMVRGALRRRAAAVGTEAVEVSGGVVRAWARGLGTNLLNPKVGVFYMAMLPQFIPAGSSHLLMGTAMATVHDIEGLIWFTVIICAAGFARTWLNRDGVRRAMDAITGTVLVTFGLDLAFGRR